MSIGSSMNQYRCPHLEMKFHFFNSVFSRPAVVRSVPVRLAPAKICQCQLSGKTAWRRNRARQMSMVAWSSASGVLKHNSHEEDDDEDDENKLQTIVDLLLADGEGEQEGEEENFDLHLPAQLPHDIAAILNQMVSQDTAGVMRPSDEFCENCGWVITSQPCSCCGHKPSSDAQLFNPAVGTVWHQRLAEQHKRQQETKQSSSSSQHAVALIFDEQMMNHRASLPPYAERPERLAAILTRLEASGLLSRCHLLPAREATDTELIAVHNPALIQAIQDASAAAATASPSRKHGTDPSEKQQAGDAGNINVTTGGKDTAMQYQTDTGQADSSQGSKGSDNPDVREDDDEQEGQDDDEGEEEEEEEEEEPYSISADSLVSAGTYHAARLAAGAAADLAQQLVAGHVHSGIAVIRPPGSQATYHIAQGGCYFNNVAVAAAAAQDAGAERVAILDWDVHHGYGTQDLFEDDASVLYVSMHRADEDFYPNTGAVTEVGTDAGIGYTVNIPWTDYQDDEQHNVGDADYIQAMLHVVLPVLHDYQPDIILVSAGFAAAKRDAVGRCNVSPAGYAHMTHMLLGVAPVGLILEGGYNLDATSRCVEACVRVLLGERPPPLEGSMTLTDTGRMGIMNAMQVQSQLWDCLYPLSLNGWMAAIREQQQAVAAQRKEQSGSPDDDDDDEDEDHGSLNGDKPNGHSDLNDGVKLLQALMKVTEQQELASSGMVRSRSRSRSPSPDA